MSSPAPPTAERRLRLLWRDIREALGGTRHDYTEGPIGRAILLLSIPMVLEMMMQAVFEVADIFFVGRLGADALAAVGLTASLLILVFALGMGLSMAATAVVARRIGEKKPEEAAHAAGQALLVAAACSVPIGIAGVVFAPDLLALMGASPAVVELGTPYCAWLLGSNVVILLLFLINAVFRGTGDADLSMRALWLANGLNIVLDPLLIFGLGPIPALGVTGAAVATTIGRGVGVLYQISLLTGRRGRIRLRAAHLRPDRALIGRLLRISGPGMLQYFVATASWLGMMRLVSVFGSAATAGYTIAIRVIVFALLPSWGMGNAAATMVGQNLGALRPSRAERAVWTAGAANTVFLALFAIVFLLYAEPVMRFFTADPQVVRYGASCLRIVSYSYIFFGFGMVTVQAFNGAGDTTTPTWINLISYWAVQIPLAYVLALPLDLGPRGVFTAIAVAQIILAGIGVVLFRRGAWQTRRV